MRPNSKQEMIRHLFFIYLWNLSSLYFLRRRLAYKRVFVLWSSTPWNTLSMIKFGHLFLEIIEKHVENIFKSGEATEPLERKTFATATSMRGLQ